MSDFVASGAFTAPSAKLSASLIESVASLRPAVLYSLAANGRAAEASQTSQFDPVLQKSQVVSGIRWRVRVQTGPSSFVDLQFLRKPDQSLQLENVEGGKTLASPL